MCIFCNICRRGILGLFCSDSCYNRCGAYDAYYAAQYGLNEYGERNRGRCGKCNNCCGG